LKINITKKVRRPVELLRISPNNLKVPPYLIQIPRSELLLWEIRKMKKRSKAAQVLSKKTLPLMMVKNSVLVLKKKRRFLKTPKERSFYLINKL
jgi:hypothetical protein